MTTETEDHFDVSGICAAGGFLYRFVSMASRIHCDTVSYLLRRTSAFGRFDGETGLLGLNFVLMVIPGANGGINKAAKEKQETDKQYDAGHAGVKSVSFVHTRGLTHVVFPGFTRLGDTAIKAQREARVNSGMCKK
jgi:hypothetical protein